MFGLLEPFVYKKTFLESEREACFRCERIVDGDDWDAKFLRPLTEVRLVRGGRLRNKAATVTVQQHCVCRRQLRRLRLGLSFEAAMAQVRPVQLPAAAAVRQQSDMHTPLVRIHLAGADGRLVAHRNAERDVHLT